MSMNRIRTIAVRMSAIGVLVVLAFAGLPAEVANAAGSIGSLSLSPDSVRNGASTQGTVTLAFADPGPTTVRLWSDDPSAAAVPTSIVVPPGAMSANFTITSNAAAPPTITTIRAATPDNGLRTANLSVNAATPAGPSLASVSFVPTSVVGGSSATGTVTFTAAMNDGAVVQLSSSNTAVARVPSEVVVNARTSSGTFNLSTSPVSANTSVTITATWFSVTRTATVVVKTGQPPAADVVRITRATWQAGLLRIEATSTNPNAILSVFSSSGSFMFDLTNNGGGRFSDQRGFVFNPLQITVRSNFGGSASASTK
jgi:hypothetical protein